jgi:hypothetical protein
LFQQLVGASFSLWRAVFLLGRERDRAASHSAAMQFLHLLVRDNAIAYPQDRETASWSAGYYLGNAMYRLRELESSLRDGGMHEPAGLKEVRDHFAKTFAGRIEADVLALWDTTFKATEEICVGLEGQQRRRQAR